MGRIQLDALSGAMRDVAPPSPLTASRRSPFLAILVLALAALAAWHNSFEGPFVFDDLPAIAENPTIQRLTDLKTVLSPPADGQTVSGRPLVNLSLAVNWASGGNRVWGYHATNLLIHVFAACALFGVIRRTLQTPRLAARFGNRATLVAFVAALLWLVHPLQTESVTYIVQRAEALVGLWLLLTLHASIRGATSPTPHRWHAVALVSALCGMASKEVMFAAPLLVLLHDRTFLAASWGDALRRRPWFYLGLALTWILLGALVWKTGTRGATAGFGLGISPWHYLLTQCTAIVHYVRLCFWPEPLVLDHGFSIVTSLSAVWIQAMLLTAVAGLTVAAIVRRSAVGFLGAWFFCLLAPSSSVVPVATQTVAEHRMYLPLAAVVVGLTVGVVELLGRRGAWLLCGAAAAGIALTAARNRDYRSAATLWHDTAVKRPLNARAHQELALALYRNGRAADSLPAFERALALLPAYGKGRHNYATALAEASRLDAAATQFELILAESPGFAPAHYGLGNVRRLQGRLDEALASYAAAVRADPAFALAHNNAALVLLQTGRFAEAAGHFEAALRARPDFADAHLNYALALAREGRPAEAIAHYEAVLRDSPNHLTAREDLGVVLVLSGRVAEGIRELESAQRLAPDRASIRNNLAIARQRLEAR